MNDVDDHDSLLSDDDDILLTMDDADDKPFMVIVSTQSYLIDSPRLIELHRMSLLPEIDNFINKKKNNINHW